MEYSIVAMNTDSVLRAPGGVRTEILEDELLLYHEEKTNVIALNATASLIWQLCDGKRNLGSIESLLTRSYPEAAERIPLEIAEAIEHLVRDGALELDDGDQPA